MTMVTKQPLKGKFSQNGNYVINYSPSCRSKPVRPLFIFGTQIKMFVDEIRELSDTP